MLTRLAAFQALRANFIASRHGIRAALSLLRQRRLTTTAHRNFFRRQGARLAELRMTDFLTIMFLAVQRFVTNIITGIRICGIGSAGYLLSILTTKAC